MHTVFARSAQSALARLCHGQSKLCGPSGITLWKNEEAHLRGVGEAATQLVAEAVGVANPPPPVPLPPPEGGGMGATQADVRRNIWLLICGGARVQLERRSEESRQCSTQNEHPAQASWEKEQQRKTTHWLPQRGRHSAEAGASPGTSTAGLCRDDLHRSINIYIYIYMCTYWPTLGRWRRSTSASGGTAASRHSANMP
ncbi:unnamed protein product [Prorocentrum cordatum]|uniref:Uncharacterized protein n=1 Tax=Prorocentrum cordatum TaxID=2364126 RepID=A0ABN9UH07_9DINO|nr:unnamed protein product [Polarella glacialis]